MAGHIAATAPHLDGSEDIGVWFDVAWAAYLHICLQMGAVGVQLDTIDELWDGLAADVDENGKPRPEEWGTSEKAQRDQANLMAMFGGGPGMGAAPSVGDEG